MGNVETILASGLDRLDVRGQRVLILIPDTTRTAPVGMLAKIVCRILRDFGSRPDLMVALGTHQPIPRKALLRHMETSKESYATDYGETKILQHAWDNSNSLAEIGQIPADLIGQITMDLWLKMCLSQ